MSLEFNISEINIKQITYANMFASEESLLELKAKFQEKMPDSVPVGKRMEVEIYVRIIEDVIPP